MYIRFTMPFHKYQREKRVTICLPDDYFQSAERYPTLYIHDGQNAFFDEKSYMGVSWGFSDYVHDHHLKVIMVAIDCIFDDFGRMDEYGPWPLRHEINDPYTHDPSRVLGGQGDDYIRWIIEDLKPLVDRRFRTLPDQTSMIGSSMGGIITAYAYFKYPWVFKKCAALSTAFFLYMDEFIDLIEHAPTHGEGLYFDCGDHEGVGNADEDRAYIETNFAIDQLLNEKGLPHSFHFFEDTTHNEKEWRKRMPLYMNYLYGEGE